MATQISFTSHTSGYSTKDRCVFPRLIALALILSAIVWLIPTAITQASSGGNHTVLAGGYVQIPDHATLRPAAVTVEAWVNIAEYQGHNQYIVFKQNSRFPNYVEGYTIYVNGPADEPHLGSCVSSADGEQVAVGSADIITGTWYHLAMTADATTISFYVNGEFKETKNTGFALDYDTLPLYIGYDGLLDDGFFYGMIDEVRIWNTTLAQATIQQWMHREVNSAHPNSTNLVGYWKLNEGSGGTAYDASGNENNGTLSGTINWVSSSAPINNLTTHRNDITALWENRASTATDSFATGLDIADVDFLNDGGDDIVFGHNNAAFANVTSDLPDEVDKRWARVWELAVTNVWPASQYVDLIFDISDAGGQGSFSESGTYFLLKRAAGSSDAYTTVEVISDSVAGDQLTFRVDVTNLGSEFTLGAAAASPTAVIMQKFAVRRTDSVIPLASIFALGFISIPLIRHRRRLGDTHAQSQRLSHLTNRL